MATSLGRVYLTGCNYELAYDLLSQSFSENKSTVRFYGILHVTNSYINWSSGSASVYTSGLQAIGTYYSQGDHTVITRDYDFYHDANGNLSAYIGAELSTTFVSGSTGGTMTLPQITRQAILTSTPNFNDEENVTIKFTNPANYRINARLEFSGTSIRRDNIPNTGTYTFELTEEERNLLRSKTPNSNTLPVRETLATCYSGTTESAYSYFDRKMTIVNANPTFTNFEFEDVNPTTLALTGNNQNIIKGYSNVKAIISTSNKAIANKYATMSKYRFSIGDTSTDITYSDSDSVNGTINNATSGTYNVYAIDSRNNSTLVTKLAANEISFENLYIDKQNCSLLRDDNQVGENAILTLNGTFWNNNFGSVSNSLTVSYRLKKTSSSTWITGTTTITPTTTDNNFTFTGLIASDNPNTKWDLDASYNVEVTVSDELSSSIVELVLNSSTPTMSLDEQGVGIMCAYNSNIGGKLQVAGKIIDGGTVLWTNTSPTSNFGAKTITLNSSDYDILEFFFLQSTTDTTVNSIRSIKGYDTRLFLSYAGDAGVQTRSRKVAYVSDTSLSFETAYTAVGSTHRTETQNYVVPLYIVGYKTNVFS